jgi:hypothetical protein
MPVPKSITETTTLAELREQLLLFKVRALHIDLVGAIYPPFPGKPGKPALTASLHHATGFHVGTGPTEATAIETAFVSLRQAFQLRDEIAQL